MSRKPRVQRPPGRDVADCVGSPKPRNDCSRHRLSCWSGPNDGTSSQESDTKRSVLKRPPRPPVNPGQRQLLTIDDQATRLSVSIRSVPGVLDAPQFLQPVVRGSCTM